MLQTTGVGKGTKIITLNKLLNVLAPACNLVYVTVVRLYQPIHDLLQTRVIMRWCVGAALWLALMVNVTCGQAGTGERQR